MIAYVLRRLAEMIPILLIASICVWAMIYAVPGGPAAVLAGSDATPETLAAITAQYGLDRPVVVQYLDWLGHALTGNLGMSIFGQAPVLDLIGQRLPASLHLAAGATIVSLILGIPAAIASARHPGSWLDRVLSGWSALALGLPTFWLGILLILAFAVQLHWLPSASAYVPIWQDPIASIRSLLMPSITLGLYVSAILARFLRASLVGQFRADYVRTARAKGLPERQIMRVHVMRNALLPFITIVGLMTAGFIGDAVVTESVFTYPGLGRLLVQAISTRDYPLIQGCIVVVLVLYMLVNLVIDIVYAYVDPRIEYS
jgi:peptide/nickel transport system permease protein